jgi:hypothetical protein
MQLPFMSNLVSQLAKLALMMAAFVILAVPAAAAGKVEGQPPVDPFADVALRANCAELVGDNCPQRIPDADPPRALIGAPYAHQFDSNGETGATFSARGEIPDGLSLAEDGLLSGVPTTAGHFHFELFVIGSDPEGTKQLVHFYVVAPPALTLDPAVPKSPTTAGVSGSVNPGGLAADVWFEFWSAEAPVPERTAIKVTPAGFESVTVDRVLTGLEPAVEYSFRLAAKTELSPDPFHSATRTLQTPLPPPQAGQTFNIEPVDGTITTKCEDEGAFTKLVRPKQVTLDCQIDASDGTVSVTASKGSSGRTQTADFWAGRFTIFQEEGDNREAVLKFAGKRRCERRKTKSAGRVQTLSRGGKGGRKLWGSGSGNYKTVGSHGSATVRGTIWLVADRCDGSTLFKVKKGTVVVRDFVKKSSVVLKAGESYIAKVDIARLP